MESVSALVLGYLLGSVPFGLILTRLFGAGDIRKIGSGNIGATNVLRTGRKGLAVATLLLDVAKGFAAVWIASLIWADSENPLFLWLIAGAGALVGHCFPAWLRFKGGKGVATMLGVSFAVDWRIGLASALVWLAVTLLTRISSLGGMASAVAAPAAAFVIYLVIGADSGLSGWVERMELATEGVFLLPIAALVVFQHRANIARIRAGSEPRVGQKA